MSFLRLSSTQDVLHTHDHIILPCMQQSHKLKRHVFHSASRMCSCVLLGSHVRPHFLHNCGECWEWRMTTKTRIVNYFEYLFHLHWVHDKTSRGLTWNIAVHIQMQTDIQRCTYTDETCCPCLWKWFWTKHIETGWLACTSRTNKTTKAQVRLHSCGWGFEQTC